MQESMDLVQIVSTGAAVRAMMKDRGIALTHSALQEFNASLKETLGDRYISIVHASIDKTNSIVLVDALRTEADYRELRRQYDRQFSLVGLSSAEEVRFARLVGRNRPGDIQNRGEFDSLVKRERDWGVEALLEKADLKIANDYRELEPLVEELRRHPLLRT